jgi:DNA-binding NarL/FixJ family response regulator
LYEIHKYVNPIGILVKSDFTADELLLAFSKMNANEFYRSKTVQQSIKDFLATNFVLDELNRQIITLLAQGIKTKNLPNHINLTLSAINKRKAQIRVFFNLDDSSDENIINAAKKRGFI